MQISDQRSPGMAKVETVVFRFRAYILAVLAVLTVVMAFNAAQLRMDAGFTKMLPIGHEYIETFQQYAEGRFAGANRVIVVLSLDCGIDKTTRVNIAKEGNAKDECELANGKKQGDIYNRDFLNTLKDATNDVFFIPGVDRGSVTSIWTPNTRFFQINEDGIASGDVVPATNPLDDMGLLRTNAGKANLVGRLVSNDLRSAMIMADLQDIDPTTRERLDYFKVAKLLEDGIRGKYASDKIDVKIIGFSKLIGDIADGAKSVFKFFAVAFLLTVLCLYVYCRSWILTAVTVSSSLCSLIWQFGFLHLLGYGLDPLAVLVPFLVFAIGVSHGVQQVNMAGAEIAAGKTKEQAARDTFTFLLVPGVVALSTCLAGFATLYIIPIQMIRELAVTASVGISLKIISNLIMLPLLVSYVAPTREYAARVQKSMAARERYWPYVAKVALPRNAFIMIGFCIVLGAFGSFLSHGVKPVANFVHRGWDGEPEGVVANILNNISRGIQIGDVHAGAAELRPYSRYNLDASYITRNFDLGLNVITVIVEVPEGACVDYPVMGLLDRFQWRMANIEGVQSSVGLPIMAKQLGVLFREGNLKWHSLPRNSAVIAQSVGQIQPDSGMLNEKCTVLPLNIYTTDTMAATVGRVVAAVKEFRAEPVNQVPGVSIRLATGNVGITAATNEVVAAAEIPMLLYVYAVVMTLVLLTYREWRGSLCCVLPLLLSTIIGNMFLTLAGIGLKISTLPVLAIAVGIGVDYGIYEYNRIQRYMAAGRNAHEAYLQALNDVGSATMFTGLTLAVGVSTWSFSALKFQADMGLLLTFMFVVNMIGAVTLLPALIAALEAVFPRKVSAIEPLPTPIHGH